MPLTLVTKSVKDAAGASFNSYWVDDGTALYAATLLWDQANNQAVAVGSASQVVGTTADDAALTAAPVPSGFKAYTTNRTAVGDGDAVYGRADDEGRLNNVPHQVRDLCDDANITITSSTSAATLLAAGSAGTFRDITALTIANTSATATEVQLLNDDGTTVRWVGYVPAGNTIGIVFATPKKAAATAVTWKFKTVTSVASVKVTVEFVTNV